MKRTLPALLVALLLLAAPGLPPAPARAQDDAGGGKGKKGRPKDGEKDGGKSPKAKERLAVGDEVKDLSLDLVEGGTWTAAGSRGKVVVLVFAGSWSSESVDALKKLGDPKGKLADAGAERLGVLRDAGREKAKEAAREHALPGRLAVDPRRAAYDRLARSGLPYTVVLDREGRIALSEGGFDETAVARKVESLSKRKD